MPGSARNLDEDEMLLEETRFRNTVEGIEEFALKITALHENIKTIVESTGNLCIQIHGRRARG